MKECPGQSFQTWRLLLSLQSSLSDNDDVLLEPYLQTWDQLLMYRLLVSTHVAVTAAA